MESSLEAPSRLGLGTNFGLLWTGQFVSQIGDRLAMVAFPALVYAHTRHSAFGTGAMLALYTLPYVLFGTIAGVIIDRFNKRVLMIVADLVRTVLVAAVPLAAAHSLPLVFVLAFLLSSVGVFFDPCKLAVLPDLVPNDRLMRANSLLSTGETFNDTVGYAIGGFVVSYLSTRLVFALDAFTFVISALLLIAIRYAAPAREKARAAADGVTGEVREALTYLRHNQAMLLNTVIVLCVCAGLGACFVLSFLFAYRVGGSVWWFGLFEGAIGAGSLVGSLTMAAFSRRVRLGRATTLGFLTLGLSLIAVALSPTAIVALVPFFVSGIANVLVLISIDTFFQQHIPEHLRGRVWGLRFTASQSALALSVLAGGALASVLSVRVLFVVAGCVVALPAVIARLLLPHAHDV